MAVEEEEERAAAHGAWNVLPWKKKKSRGSSKHFQRKEVSGATRISHALFSTNYEPSRNNNNSVDGLTLLIPLPYRPNDRLATTTLYRISKMPKANKHGIGRFSMGKRANKNCRYVGSSGAQRDE